MEIKQILALIRQKIGTLIMWGILIAALSFLFLVVTQKNFKVNSDFLVVQDQTSGQDYYSLSKSAEYLGKVLSEAVYSDLFIEEVIKTEKVNSEILPFDKKKRLKEWSKIVKVERNLEFGIIGISVFGNDSGETIHIAEGINEVLTKKNYLFRGYGQDIDIRILSGPITEKNPSFSNIILAMIGGFLIGFLASLAWLFYQEKRNENKFILYSGNGESGSATVDFQKPDEYEESLEYLNK